MNCARCGVDLGPCTQDLKGRPVYCYPCFDAVRVRKVPLGPLLKDWPKLGVSMHCFAAVIGGLK